MRRATVVFFSILLVVSLIIFQMPAAADDTGHVPIQATFPKPLTPRLSADGNTLYNGGSILAVVDDPNPSTLRRIPAPAGVSDQPGAATASFSITYIPNGGTDRWGEPCYTFPEEAKTAFGILEKGAYIGAHAISGAVMDPAPLKELVPDFLEKDAPLEGEVTKEDVCLLTSNGKITIPNLLMSMYSPMNNH